MYMHQKDMSIKEVRLCARNMLAILGSTCQHDWRDIYDHLMSMRIFTLIMNKIFIDFHGTSNYLSNAPFPPDFSKLLKFFLKTG
jgi:hypothetical protein